MAAGLGKDEEKKPPFVMASQGSLLHAPMAVGYARMGG